MCKYYVVAIGKDGHKASIANSGFTDPYDAAMAARHYTSLDEDGTIYECVHEDSLCGYGIYLEDD